MNNLTPRQLQILALIRSGCNSFHGLATALGKRPGNSVIGWHLERLKRKGLVTWQSGKSRTLRLTESGRQAVAGYVLGPGGYVGEWEAVEELAEGQDES